MEHIHGEHIHTHIHSHDDDHGLTHPHTNNELHTHPVNTISLKEVKALLSYMIVHNEHHAEELADFLDILPKEAKKKLSIAIGSFEAANVELEEVLRCLE